MARIIFVVNEHPNEAFGISAARETAKELQSQGFRLLVEGKDKIPKKPEGNEIVWVKVKPAETLLGRALKGLPLETERQQKSGVEVEWYWSNARGFEVRESRAKKYGPAAIYGFHCAPQGDRTYFKRGPADYDIQTNETYSGIPTRIVEIKSAQKELPARARARIAKSATGKVREPFIRYLTHTTSQTLTRNAGLTPEAFGKALAKKILEDVQRIEKRLELRRVRGRVPRPRKRMKRIARRR